MVNLKPKSEKEPEIKTVNYRSFQFKHLSLFILVSAIAHAILFLFLAKYEAVKPVPEKEDSKPIEFVVVPPEEKSEEPPPETNNVAAENSVANRNVQPEKTAPNERITEEPAKKPSPAAEPPAPTPQVSTPPKATPEPAPESTPETEPQKTISGADAPVTSSEPEASEKPQVTEKETVATRLPPQPEPVPQSNSSEGSAADLLGGDYKKTLADGGGEAFFSPEALTHRTVLNPGQINALRDVDMSAYFAEIKRRVKRNWNPSYSSQEQTTYLTFNVQKNGQITDLKITESSGSEKLDRESVAAVQNSAPFAPLPADFPLEKLEIEFSFNIYLY